MSTNPSGGGPSTSFSGADGENASGGGEAKATPKDAQVITEILKDMGIQEWEPKVVNQLLEFLYRYITTVVEDAKMVSSHARKKVIDIEDVRLAVQMYNEQNFYSAPSRDMLLEVARSKNANPLPPPKSSSGLRLPPDRFCLTSCNYRLKNKKPPQHSRSGGATYTIRPGGGNQASRQQNLPVITMNQTVMPRIQIQPGAAAANAPTFTMTVNAPAMKRKADAD